MKKLPNPHVSGLWKFIKERYSISLKKDAGLPKPWTKDPILQQYRFCSVYREHDKVTKWIAKNWRDNHKDEPDLWFAMAVARFINWPPTLASLCFPVPWDPREFKRVLHRRMEQDQQVFTGVYIIPSAGPKIDYICDEVLTPLWGDRDEIRPKGYDTLDGFHEILLEHNGLGSFMAAQIVADMKYVEPLLSAKDWHTWAASGPGSRRGLNYVCDRQGHWKEAEWRKVLGILHHWIDHKIEKAGMPELHAQDLQNCLCEFGKYERTRLGEGKPRSRYPGLK